MIFVVYNKHIWLTTRAFPGDLVAVTLLVYFFCDVDVPSLIPI